MTVTKGKRNYRFPANSAKNSDVESLHLSSASVSDTESLHNEPLSRGRPFVPPALKSINYEDHVILKKTTGRKKLRRYHNCYTLQTLAEEEEKDGSLVVIMEPYDSPFSKLLHDENALQYWNDFVDKSEEEQAKVIATFNKKKTKCEENPQKEKPFARISSRIKRTIKIKKNLSLEQVKKLEDDLIAFFKMTPSQVYVKCLPTYFERLLLCAIAQYHGLKTLDMVENGVKSVEIFNKVENWVPAECFLTDFLAQFRK